MTSKGKTNIRAFSKALTSPLMTAEWEEKLLSIEKGKYNAKQFINEMKDFTKKEIVGEIKHSDQNINMII